MIRQRTTGSRSSVKKAARANAVGATSIEYDQSANGNFQNIFKKNESAIVNIGAIETAAFAQAKYTIDVTSSSAQPVIGPGVRCIELVQIEKKGNLSSSPQNATLNSKFQLPKANSLEQDTAIFVVFEGKVCNKTLGIDPNDVGHLVLECQGSDKFVDTSTSSASASTGLNISTLLNIPISYENAGTKTNLIDGNSYAVQLIPDNETWFLISANCYCEMSN